MVSTTFPTALAGVLKSEGGYSNHPSDPGGPTNKGITIATYRTIKPNASAQDLQRITSAEVASIYKRDYWDKCGCDSLPKGLDYCTFDYAVNSGPARAVSVLCALVGVPQSKTPTKAMFEGVGKRNPADLINAMCDERMTFLRRLKTWPVFGKGWTARVSGVRALSLTMDRSGGGVVTTPAPTAPLPVPTPQTPIGKGGEAKPKASEKGAGAGGLLATIGAAIQGWASGFSLIDIAAIVVGGAVLTAIAIVVIRARHSARNTTPATTTPVPTAVEAGGKPTFYQGDAKA